MIDMEVKEKLEKGTISKVSLQKWISESYISSGEKGRGQPANKQSHKTKQIFPTSISKWRVYNA